MGKPMEKIGMLRRAGQDPEKMGGEESGEDLG